MNTILLTGTIDPSKFNNTGSTLVNADERLNQYCTAIKKWITNTNFQKIIFIENSGYKFDYEYFEALANEHKKQFEFILAKSYVEETIKFGKSYGEIRLMNEAVEKSKLLKNEDSFYKCTGRLFIKNCDKILKEKHSVGNLFLGIPSDKWAFTWFFKAEKDFYINVLSDSYDKVNDNDGIFLEHIYYQKLISHRNEFETFKQYPNVEGVSAGSNSKFHSGRLRLMYKNFRIKTGFFGI